MTLSIAVVTRRAGVTLTLGSKAHTLIEVRPSGGWLARPWEEDVVVLDLESSAATTTAVRELRRAHPALPIVVIGANDVLTEGLDGHTVLTVPLPMTATTLLDTVDRAAALAVPHAAPPTEHDASARGVAVDTELLPQVLRSRHAASHGRDAPATKVAPVPVVIEPEPAAPGISVAIESPVDLVRALLPRIAALRTLQDIAELVRSLATEGASAGASAVLVPDNDVWRVAAGSGLRPLESRLQINAGHWLVNEIALRDRGLLIRNTDIARSQLAGSPLASWAQLLAAPVGASRAIVVLARADEPFSRAELTKVATDVAGLAQAMDDALATRELARQLIDYLDLVD